jgi:hypothetical protein
VTEKQFDMSLTWQVTLLFCFWQEQLECPLKGPHDTVQS